MSMKLYNLSSFICNNEEEKKILFKILNKSPEIIDYNEDYSSKSACKYGLRCFNINCDLYHGLLYDGRKILIKKFNKERNAIQTKRRKCEKNEEFKHKQKNYYDTYE